MANLVSRIQSIIHKTCHARKCGMSGCSVGLKNAPQPFFLIQMDCDKLPIGQNETRCDYIFIGGSDRVWLVPMELKKGGLGARAVIEQLQAGAKFAEKIIPRNEQVSFLPIAVFGGKVHRIELRKLQQSTNQIRFRNQRSNIKLLRCGSPLAEAINKASKSK